MKGAMTCAEVEARLGDITDGRLQLAGEVRLHAHVEGCAACRARTAFWRRLVPGLRALAPAPPGAMQARRMQLAIERQLGPAPPVAPARRRPAWTAALAALGVAGAAAALVLALRAPRAAGGYATLARVRGALTADGRALAAATTLPDGTTLALGAGGEAELALSRGTTVTLSGPARLTLGGGARTVALVLAQGTVAAAVAHRLPGETFAVITRDARVEVRGTRFTVHTATAGETAAAGSWVRVDEGRVAVAFADGRSRLVSAGETVVALRPEPVPMPALAPAPAAAETPDETPEVAPEVPACEQTVRACNAAALAARESMRGGDYGRALRLAAAGGHDERGATGGCARALGACDDELRYLRAEALRGAGRLAAAVAAYRALDRRGAPAAMRQNALYAAAELERRQGRPARARAAYERALAAAPRGALREEALAGAMDSAAASGDAARARSLARRYLAELPDGREARLARRLAGDGAQP